MRITYLLITLCVVFFFWNTSVVDHWLMYDTVPGWNGLYALLLGQSDTGPLFFQISHGEIWRLFSPAFLHRDLMHLAFNMLWLWVLGRPIEERIGAVRTVVLTLILAAVSNTAQYLMSGPLFLGYSGVALGLAGFTWSREKIAPWEGYPLHRSTVLFLVIYVLALMGLQVVSFILMFFKNVSFSASIANTAHIAGALTGLSLGRLKFFAHRKSHEHA